MKIEIEIPRKKLDELKSVLGEGDDEHAIITAIHLTCDEY